MWSTDWNWADIAIQESRVIQQLFCLHVCQSKRTKEYEILSDLEENAIHGLASYQVQILPLKGKEVWITKTEKHQQNPEKLVTWTGVWNWTAELISGHLGRWQYVLWAAWPSSNDFPGAFLVFGKQRTKSTMCFTPASPLLPWTTVAPWRHSVPTELLAPSLPTPVFSEA